MSLVTDAVDEMEKKLAGSGCDHGTVALSKSPERDVCPFIEGTCIEASYGGKRIFIATSYPIEVKTRVSFMYGQELNSPVQRTAACAILNSLSSFMCFPRISGACPEGCGEKCLDELKEKTAERKVYLNGTMPGLQKRLEDRIVPKPEDADIIIVSGDGIFSDEGVEICDRYRDKKEMIFFAPETSGLAGMLNLRHWCPYGRK
jgi:fructose-specific component phosphotransferase system IIB-like protein